MEQMQVRRDFASTKRHGCSKFGIARADFDGTSYGSECLNLSRGQTLLLLFCSDEDARWSFGAECGTDNEWMEGWFPSEYWKAVDGDVAVADANNQVSTDGAVLQDVWAQSSNLLEQTYATESHVSSDEHRRRLDVAIAGNNPVSESGCEDTPLSQEMLQEILRPASDSAIMPWPVPCKEGWGGSCPSLDSICKYAVPTRYPLLHMLATEAQTRTDIPRLWDLPFDAIVRAVFTRAAERAEVDCRGKEFTNDLLQHVLGRLNVQTVRALGFVLEAWSEQSRAVRDAMKWTRTMAELKESNRPGAWLLDTINTMLGVLNKSIKRPLHRLQFEVLSNR